MVMDSSSSFSINLSSLGVNIRSTEAPFEPTTQLLGEASRELEFSWFLDFLSLLIFFLALLYTDVSNTLAN
jgi:hypothetical protein